MNKKYTKKQTVFSVVAILVGVLMAANLYKVSATMSLLMIDLHISVATAGWLVTALNIMGLVLGIPAGWLILKIGSEKLSLFALIVACAGSLVGAWSQSVAVLFFSRLMEGIGFALIGVTVPSIIADSFPEEKRGLPMAIWSCWIALGLLVALNVGNAVTNPVNVSSWHSLWLAISGLLALVGVVFFCLMPRVRENSPSEEHLSFRPKMFFNAKAWCLALIFLCFSAGVISITNFTTVYCQNALQMSFNQANSFTSLLSFSMIIGGIGVGVVLNHCQNRNLFLLGSMLACAIIFTVSFQYTASLAVVFMLFGGVALSAVPAVIFTLAPKCADSPQSVGVVMGIMAVGQSLGGFFAPLIGSIMEQFGYNGVCIALAIIGGIGVALAVIYQKLDR